MDCAEVATLAVASVWVVACASLAWSYVWRLMGLWVSCGQEWSRSDDLSRRCDHLMAATSCRWVCSLAEQLREATHDGQRIVVVNEVLSGLDHEIRWRRQRPKAAIWLSLGGTASILIGGYLAGGRTALLWTLPIAVAGALAGWSARRIGDDRAKVLQGHIDSVIQALVGDLYDAEVALPVRRQRRRVR